MKTTAIDVWGGIECTLNRVGDRWHDQIERLGHARRESDLDLIAGLGIHASLSDFVGARRAVGRRHDRLVVDRRAPLRRCAPWASIRSRPSCTTAAAPPYTSLIDPDFPRLLARFAEQVG